MKETEGSLRTYFVVFGVIALLISVRDWSRIRAFSTMLPLDWKIAMYVPIATRVVMGIGFFIAGIKLPQALLSGAGWIKKLLVFCAVMIFVNGALATAILDLDTGKSGIVGAVVGLLVTGYLYRTVTRLAVEAQQRAGLPAPPPAAKVV
jgi:hypothetical protein